MPRGITLTARRMDRSHWTDGMGCCRRCRRIACVSVFLPSAVRNVWRGERRSTNREGSLTAGFPQLCRTSHSSNIPLPSVSCSNSCIIISSSTETSQSDKYFQRDEIYSIVGFLG
jgi:hypothetical protein